MSLAALCPRKSVALQISLATQQAGLIWRTPHTQAEPFLQNIGIDKPRVALLTQEYLRDLTLFNRLKAISPDTWVLICLPAETQDSVPLWEVLDQVEFDILCKLDELVCCLRTLKEGNFFASSLLSLTPTETQTKLILPGWSTLSLAERRVLKGLLDYKTGPQLADELFRSEKTVNNHKYAIAQKLCVSGGPGSLNRWIAANHSVLTQLINR